MLKATAQTIQRLVQMHVLVLRLPGAVSQLNLLVVDLVKDPATRDLSQDPLLQI